MYKRILVPLDGSARAERAIPVAARIARALGGSVILLRVATAPVDTGKYSSTSGYVEEEADTDLTGATSYLENIAGSDVPGWHQNGSQNLHRLSRTDDSLCLSIGPRQYNRNV